MINQFVPSWEIEENTNTNRPLTLPVHAYRNAHSTPLNEPMLDYEVAELTWENGQLGMHGFGFPRSLFGNGNAFFSSENPRVSGTLDSIVDLSTCPPPVDHDALEHLPRFHHHCPTVAALNTDVPCSSRPTSAGQNSARVPGPLISAMVGSCRGAGFDSSRVQSTTFGSESGHVEIDSWDMDLDVDFTSTSQEHTSFGMPLSSHSMPTTVECQDSKRRDKINQRMKTLQKLVPNSSKTDRASVLDEVIEYTKQLQTQVQMMRSLPHPQMMMMMMPMTTMQQQLQMSMMAAQMGMGMGAMDINSINRLGPADAVPPMLHHPATLLPLQTAPWDGSIAPLHPSASGVLPDAFSTF